MRNDGADVLFDDYLEEGTGFESFRKAMRDHAARTGFSVIYPSNIEFLSFHKTELRAAENGGSKKAHLYFIINRDTLKRMESTGAPLPIANLWEDKNSTEMEERRKFFRNIEETTKLMMKVTDTKGADHFFGISSYAMSTLATRAGMGGERIHTPSLFRDCDIANGLLRVADKNASEKERRRTDRLAGDGITIMYRRRLFEKKNKRRTAGGTGMVYAAFSGNYKPFDAKLPLQIIESINGKAPLGEMVVTDWSIDHGITSVRIEFPDKAKELAKRYGLDKPIIPGILIVTSDCGLSSMTVKGTVRFKSAKSDGSDGYAVIANVSVKHHCFVNQDVDSDHVLKLIEESIYPAYDSYIEQYAAVKDAVPDDNETKTAIDRQKRKAAIQEAVLHALQKTEISSLVGKKKCYLLADAYCEEFKNKPFTVGTFFERLISDRTLTEEARSADDDSEIVASKNDLMNSAMNRLRIEIAKAPFVMMDTERAKKKDSGKKQTKNPDQPAKIGVARKQATKAG